MCVLTQAWKLGKVSKAQLMPLNNQHLLPLDPIKEVPVDNLGLWILYCSRQHILACATT